MIDDVSFYINICLYYVHYTFNDLFYIFLGSDVCLPRYLNGESARFCSGRSWFESRPA